MQHAHWAATEGDFITSTHCYIFIVKHRLTTVFVTVKNRFTVFCTETEERQEGRRGNRTGGGKGKGKER